MSESKFAKEILHYHNLARVKYGNVPPLSLDSTLSSISQNYAEQLAYYDSGLIHNENRHGTGENLYSMTNMKPTAKRVVDSWVNYEVGMYDFNRGDFSSQTGHFTQVVWKDTQKMGVGIARGGDTWYIVCNYSPAGNVIGKFRQNVFPPTSTPSIPNTTYTTTTTNTISSNYNNNNNSNLIIKRKPINILKPLVKDHKKMYTFHTAGESLLSLFERYLSNNNNRWRDLLDPFYSFNKNYNNNNNNNNNNLNPYRY